MISLPAQIGEYKPIKRLGGGTFADAYLAQSTNQIDSPPVVVKWLRSQAVFDEQYRESFYRELRLGRELDHPRILKVSDWGEWESRPYLVTDFMPGGSPENLMEREGPLSIDGAIDIARQVCEALVYCSEDSSLKPVIHRDLTPDNILLDKDGHVKVADFGIATAKELVAHYSRRTFRAWGKPCYMSREQIDGEQGDPRMDVFSLGIVLFELLTDQVPYGSHVSGHAEIRIIHQDTLIGKLSPPTLQHHLPNIPARLDQAVQRAIAVDPTHGWQSPREFLEALQHELPKPTVEPSLIRFIDVPPGGKQTASFVIDNIGGPYENIRISSVDSWLTVKDGSSSARRELPRKVDVEAEGLEWSKGYVGTISVKLDEEATSVLVELFTKHKPAGMDGRQHDWKLVSAKISRWWFNIELKYSGNGHSIQITSDILAVERVRYDGRLMSKRRSWYGHNHSFQVFENGKTVRYEAKLKASVLGENALEVEIVRDGALVAAQGFSTWGTVSNLL